MIRHGTWHGYSLDGCHCTRCTRAWSTYVQRCKLDRDLDRSRLVDPTPAYTHVAELVEQWDVAPYRCWIAAGASESWARSIAYTDDGNRWLERGLVEAAVTLTVDDLDDEAWCANDEPRRLYRQLLDGGWTSQQVAYQLECSIDVLRWRARRTTVATLKALRALATGTWLRCVDCGDTPYGGGSRCKPCLDTATLPSAEELADRRRRAEAAAARRRYRLAARQRDDRHEDAA